MVIVGAGMVGAACAYYAAQAGLRVLVLDRGPIAGGTSGAGEGNLLVSDHLPGPSLDLALHSHQLWRSLSHLDIELERKGGLVVAPSAVSSLFALADRQRASDVEAIEVGPDELSSYEPRIAGDLAGGVYYPQDMQVQPMLAAATLLRGLPVQCGVEVRGILPGLTVETDNGDRISTGAVVNAAGVWGAEVAALAGTRLPISPRRGFILVTEPLGSTSAAARGVAPPIRHKVYSASYVSNVVSSSEDLQTSAVVESTRAGTVLIGASRERVGFEPSYPLDVLRRLAAQAVALFPFLADVSVIRTYRGFRPYTPDHLPVIGPDPAVPGLYHACGHEGAGIGLAPATGALIAAMLTGKTPPLDPHPYRPERFT